MADNTNVYEALKSALSDLKKAVDKEVSEVHRCKNEVAALKMYLDAEMNSGQFIRDEGRIIISAPEIIIGNVDKAGRLLGYGNVTVKGSSLDLEASGDCGCIRSRGTMIRSEAVDPGTDGKESIVHPTSCITGKARSIAFDSEHTGGAFVYGAAPSGGISLRSDTTIDIDSRTGCESVIKDIDSRTKALDKRVGDLNSTATKDQQDFDSLIKKVTDILDSQKDLNDNSFATRTNMCDLLDTINGLKAVLPSLYAAVDRYSATLSELAEAKRQSKELKKAKESLSKKKSEFKKKSTGSSVAISAENLYMNCSDADGNIRDNASAGIKINSVNLSLTSKKSDGSLIDKSKVVVNSQNLLLSTSDTKFKSKTDTKNADNPAVGSFKLISKDINVEAVDYELKDSKLSEKALTSKGSMAVRVEKFSVSATDTEGKASGSISLNAKKTELKSMDVDKEKRTDKQLAAGSSSLLLAEKIYEGAADIKNRSKQIQLNSEVVGVFAKNTAEMQQGKAILQLDGGKAALAGSKTDIYGDTTVNAKTAFKGDIQAPKASIDNLEAKTSFKSANISDGIAVPAPPASASLSAKLKEEDAPKASQA